MAEAKGGEKGKMGKIKEKVLLCYEKHEIRVFSLTTEQVYLELFLERDKAGYYDELKAMKSIYYQDAKKGDFAAAKVIILYRSSQGYEYEKVKVMYPVISSMFKSRPPDEVKEGK